jgi:hypothetical protein
MNWNPDELEQDVRGAAMDLYMLFMTQFTAWRHPEEGAVSPAASAFFEASPPAELGFVRFARWLMMGHESDDGHIYYLSPEVALDLVNALDLGDADEVSQMRQAIRHAASVRHGGTSETNA